jgi:hypothetical protein
MPLPGSWISAHFLLKNKFKALKVLPNEKRGGLKVVSFDRSWFKVGTNENGSARRRWLSIGI